MRVLAAAHPGELYRLLGRTAVDLVLLDSQCRRFPDPLIIKTLESVAAADLHPHVIRVGCHGTASYLSRKLRVESVSCSDQQWSELELVCQSLIGPRKIDERRDRIRQQRPVWKLFGKVLCIDDDVRLTRLLQIRMAEFGIEVSRAATGIEGFDMAVRYRPDVIVTDFVMPEGLGSYMLGRLRDCEIDIPVVFLVDALGPGQAGFERQMQDLGAARVLTKPLQLRELLVELGQHFPLPEPPGDARRHWPDGLRLDEPHTSTVPRRRPVEARIKNLYYPGGG